MCQKRLFFNVLKVILLENTLPFWDCLYGSRKIENPVNCSACAVNENCDRTITNDILERRQSYT